MEVPNIQNIYTKLEDMGVLLRLNEKGILIAKPRSKVTPYAQELIKINKPGLVALLEKRTVHDFHSSLRKSNNGEIQRFLEIVYRKAFYNFAGWIPNNTGNSESQRRGCDSLVYLTNDREIRIDEKIRYKKYGDIALEYISNDRKNTPGWIEKDLSIDYLNYIIYPIRRAYILPWQALKTVWIQNRLEWLEFAQDHEKGFFIAKAPNNTYNTLSCCIPDTILIEAITGTMVLTL